MSDVRARSKTDLDDASDLRKLQSSDIAAINHALGKIGLFGEVHLVVENGRLRFIRTVRSETVASGYDVQSRTGS